MFVVIKKSFNLAPKLEIIIFMKKILFLLLASIFVVSCKTTGTVAETTKGTRKANKVIKGLSWLLLYNQYKLCYWKSLFYLYDTRS